MNALFAALAAVLALLVAWWLIGKIIVVGALGVGVFFLFWKKNYIPAGLAFGVAVFFLFGFWASVATIGAFCAVHALSRHGAVEYPNGD